MNNKKIILLVLIVAITSITIAYAVLSTSLSISGNTEVQGAEWGMSITDFRAITTGTATYTSPSIEGTTLSNYTVSLTKPGDSVEFSFFAKNTGSIAAEIASIINSTPVCTSTTGNTADAEMVCNNLKITFSHISLEIKVGEIYPANSTAYCLSTDPNTGKDGMFYLLIEYDSNATSVPTSSVTISNLKNQINFIQTDKECNFRQGGIIDPF